MILTTHAIVGAGVAQLFPNHPVIGFLAGVASHYLSDTIPHWDYGTNFSSIEKANDGNSEILNKIVFGPKFLGEASIVIFDTFLGLWLAWLLWYNFSVGNSLLIILGALGGILPDYLQIVYGLWKNRLTIMIQKIHQFFHVKDKFKIKNAFGGILAQALFIVSVVIIVRLIG